MKNIVLIDANYIIRFFSKEQDEHYQKSKEFFEDLAIGYEIKSFDNDIKNCLKK